jgi:hypothetical protein
MRALTAAKIVILFCQMKFYVTEADDDFEWAEKLLTVTCGDRICDATIQYCDKVMDTCRPCTELCRSWDSNEDQQFCKRHCLRKSFRSKIK